MPDPRLTTAIASPSPNLTMTIVIVGTFLLGSSALSYPRQSPPDGNGPSPETSFLAFKIERDLALSFDHRLGAADAQRRVAARLERLRAEFADRVGSSTVVWTGNNAVVEVSAFGQHATGHVYVTDSTVRIQAHLPLLLAPLGGRIESFLTKLSVETLQGGPLVKSRTSSRRH